MMRISGAVMLKKRSAMVLFIVSLVVATAAYTSYAHTGRTSRLETGVGATFCALGALLDWIWRCKRERENQASDGEGCGGSRRES